jgi:hypothetical protein
VIKEELPLSESFPYSFNPNRSKNFYNNVTIQDGSIDFERIKNDIEDMISKFTKKDNKVVVIFDNISTMPNDYDSLVNGLSSVYQLLSERV